MKNRLAGRFLPSRVYARWKWTVRFGLAALPLILFIAGGVVCYLTPNTYRSKIVFEYLGKRPAAEAVALMKSREVISEASRALEAPQILGVDSDEAVESISRNTATEVDPKTGFIELTAVGPQKEFNRDLTVALPKALDFYEKSNAAAELTTQIEAAGKLARGARDGAEEKRTELLNWFAVHPGEVKDLPADLAIDRLRSNWQNSLSRANEASNRLADLEAELAALKGVIQIHSQPTISDALLTNDTGNSLGEITLRALASGLVFALAAPYLLELAFPRLRRKVQKPLRTWSEKPDELEKIGSTCKS